MADKIGTTHLTLDEHFFNFKIISIWSPTLRSRISDIVISHSLALIRKQSYSVMIFRSYLMIQTNKFQGN